MRAHGWLPHFRFISNIWGYPHFCEFLLGKVFYDWVAFRGAIIIYEMCESDEERYVAPEGVDSASGGYLVYTSVIDSRFRVQEKFRISTSLSLSLSISLSLARALSLSLFSAMATKEE